jgi:hypothetical protein
MIADDCILRAEKPIVGKGGEKRVDECSKLIGCLAQSSRRE